VILKPSSETPLTALMLAEILLEAGLPPASLSVLPMSGTEAGALAERPEIRKVTFTGSAVVGWELRKRAHMKKVTLELGGNAGAIVHGDWDDIPGAAARIAVGGYAYSGQVCISVQRIFVHNSVYARFMEEFVRVVGAIKRGDPLDEATGIGPMINEGEAKRVESWVDEAVSQGAVVVAGGPREGAFYPPTVIENATAGMKVACEEVFGPVTVVTGYDDFDEALDSVNDSRFGLQAGVFARDERLVRRAFETLEVGGVIAGDFPTFRVDRMPYGGVKESGAGREGLRWAIRDMCELRLLVTGP
jgi:acyl-CoA reductase-like NAD-dependent aldehyde dehydrogenase